MSTTTTTTTPPLVRFYSPSASPHPPDRQTPSLLTILSYQDHTLESSHSYIQHLFPLPEPSPFNPSAPVVDRATFDAFRSDARLRSRLRRSLDRMLAFYGFQLVGEGEGEEVRVEKAANWSHASGNWVRGFNHNHLRITRILRSLRVLGLEREAGAFFRALGEVFEGGRGGIRSSSMMFWTRAAQRPLYLAPDDETDRGQGRDFLYEFEARKAAGHGNDGEAKDGTNFDGGMDGKESSSR